MFKALVVRVNGSIAVTDLPKEYLEPLQELVGGYIELVHFLENVGCYMNEDGKELGLPPNPIANELARALEIGLLPGDVIVGNVVFVGPPDDDGCDTDVPEDFVRLVTTVQSFLGFGTKEGARDF